LPMLRRWPALSSQGRWGLSIAWAMLKRGSPAEDDDGS
jgi:hypothetical protein